MIQLQALTYIIENKDEALLTTYGKEYFSDYENVYEFLIKHYNKYKNIPDIHTVVGEFTEFPVITVTESKQFIEDKLYEEYVQRKGSSIINESNSTKNNLWLNNPIEARNVVIQQLSELHPPHKDYGVDIIKEAKKRYDLLLDKKANIEKYFISSGLEELDKIIGGFQRGEDVIVLFARTNNCKTWIAEKFITSAWAQKNNVGFLSPEMSAESIGYRFDTLFGNFNNRAILGKEYDANDVDSFDIDKYKSFLTNLPNNNTVFNVTTPKTWDNYVTVSKIRNWIIDLDLKMIVIDGLTYLKNERGNIKQNTTDRLTDIMEDLMSLSVELKIPIIVVVQANREAARDKDGEVNTDAPELDTIRGSDGISHNASKVISLVHRKDTITLYINKNRNDVVGQKLIYNYNINRGIFTYIPNPKDGITPIDEVVASANNSNTDEEPVNLYEDIEDF